MSAPRHARAPGGRYRSSLRSRPFRRVWYAQLLSELGDAAGRIALAVLATAETGSALGAGLVVAVSVVPSLGPGQVLTAWCERFPRRQVLVVSDLIRAGCFLVMVLPMPVELRFVPLLVASLASPPFDAVRNALVPTTVPDEALVDALSLQTLTNEATRLVGLAAGGAAAALISPELALVANALTFVLSALILVATQFPNHAAAGSSTPPRQVLRDAAAFLRTDPLARRVVWLYPALLMFSTVPETLAVPFVTAEYPDSPEYAGLLAATVSAAILVAAPLVPSPTSERSLVRQAAGLALAGSVVAAVCFALDMSVVPAFAAFAAIGLVLVCRVNLGAALSKRLPDELRATGFSLLDGVVSAALILCGVVGGVVADAAGPRATFVGSLAAASGVALLGRFLPVRSRHRGRAPATSVERP